MFYLFIYISLDPLLRPFFLFTFLRLRIFSHRHTRAGNNVARAMEMEVCNTGNYWVPFPVFFFFFFFFSIITSHIATWSFGRTYSFGWEKIWQSACGTFARCTNNVVESKRENKRWPAIFYLLLLFSPFVCWLSLGWYRRDDLRRAAGARPGVCVRAAYRGGWTAGDICCYAHTHTIVGNIIKPGMREMWGLLK